MSCFIYQLPSWVLDDLCRNMDTLSEWDWMHFASYVITDLTQLRKIKSMERVQGVSITRELLWWWGMRQATVQQLLDLLHRLELYRAAQILLSWKPAPEVGSLPAAVWRSRDDDAEKAQPTARPSAGPGPGPGPEPARASLLPPCEDAPQSLKTPLSESKQVSTVFPQPEAALRLSGDSLFWKEADVVEATSDFSQDHRISEGVFADIYRGHRGGTPLVFKRLRETACSGPGLVSKFFEAEVQLCQRCSHPHVLPLLGLCSGEQFCGLIYPYMASGSLQDRLRGQGDADALTWPQRVHICSGLLRAVLHLHGLDIIHGNIKSSNVLLDQDLTPKLAHPVTHQCPANRGSKYTTMKTRIFQASAAYLPEDFIRVGQLTKRVDIFSCGVVLAEVLTGIPAMDNSRSPVYLKDLLLHELPGDTASLCSRKTGVERAMAAELCRRHLERRAGPLREDCAQALATAACLCLRRRNASLAEVCGLVAAVEERLAGQEASLPWSGLSQGTSSSSNTPEETDDVDLSSLGAASAAWHPRTEEGGTQEGAGRPQASRDAEADSPSEAAASAQPPRGDAAETSSWKIEINEAKRRLMEDILLYKEDKLDSVELFGP